MEKSVFDTGKVSVEDLKTQVALAQKKIKYLEEIVDDLKIQLALTQQEAKRLETENYQKTYELCESDWELNKIRRTLAAKEKSIDRMQETIIELEAEINGFKQQKSQQSQLDTHSIKSSGMRAMESFLLSLLTIIAVLAVTFAINLLTSAPPNPGSITLLILGIAVQIVVACFISFVRRENKNA